MDAKYAVRIGVLALCLGGVLATFWVGRPVWSRSAKIEAHLRSGGWNVISGKLSLDAALSAKFRSPKRPSEISLFAGSGEAYPLDDATRAESITTLGNSTLGEGPIVDLEVNQLVQRYARLIDQANGAPDIPVKVWTDANKKFSSFSLDLGEDFPANPVDTKPGADSLDDWERVAVALPQSSKCLGTAQPLHGSEPPIGANISIQPRYVDVTFDRPWFSEGLAEEAASSRTASLYTHFRSGGNLSRVPQHLIVVMPDKVTITGTVASTPSALASLVKRGECCRVSCLGQSFDLRPGTGRTTSSKAIVGLRYTPVPTAFALVSYNWARK